VIERRLVVERDADSPTGWTGWWIEVVGGRVERVTTTCVDPVAVVDEMEALALERLGAPVR